MHHSPDSDETAKSLSLTDRLAIDRTTLANERTLLAYIRTALGLLALGVTFLDFLKGVTYTIAGWTFIILGPLLLVGGAVRFLRVRRRLAGAWHVAPPSKRH